MSRRGPTALQPVNVFLGLRRSICCRRRSYDDDYLETTSIEFYCSCDYHQDRHFHGC